MQIERFDEATRGIMTPEQRAEARRLAWLRESARVARERAAAEAATEAATPPPPSTQPNEPQTAQAAGEGDRNNNSHAGAAGRNQLLDPLIYRGLYSPSGFNIVNVLIRVRIRPNPKIDIGLIDPSSCALLLCDLAQPDTPIIYSSDAFTSLTRYTSAEILGQNCRFLQSPSGRVERGSDRAPHGVDDATVKELREKLARKEEAQVELTNYKKGGERFENILTVVPIKWEEAGEVRWFAVGFLADRGECFLGPGVGG